MPSKRCPNCRHLKDAAGFKNNKCETCVRLDEIKARMSRRKTVKT